MRFCSGIRFSQRWLLFGRSGQAMPSEGLAASAPVSDGMTWRTVCFRHRGNVKTDTGACGIRLFQITSNTK
ncbi:hypothetical protein CIJ63_07345 [Neisseria meningitidis]|nr:hypothetical protein CIJ71_09155 [Neisseria meningitidis]RGA90017.1 hypothetical protein CIJ65_08745 [Neisseria meningitidis]RGB19927.1 hypothetical protein CIJ63_07345 [Neisseria meningitidis]RJR78511.1 hypothetical protein CIJ56_11230 [Neisseria meningitidis]